VAKRKKRFPCGHQGQGQQCHRCAQENHSRQQQEQGLQSKQEQRRAWKASFEHDPIDLTALPRRVVLKARDIIARLQQSGDYRQFRGKRLRHDRKVISIPVTRDYRLLCREQDKTLQPEAVVSHQDYNVCKPGG